MASDSPTDSVRSLNSTVSKFTNSLYVVSLSDTTRLQSNSLDADGAVSVGLSVRSICTRIRYSSELDISTGLSPEVGHVHLRSSSLQLQVGIHIDLFRFPAVQPSVLS